MTQAHQSQTDQLRQSLADLNATVNALRIQVAQQGNRPMAA